MTQPRTMGTASTNSPHAALPEWPSHTIAVLSTADGNQPHAIPVSAPVRAGERPILINPTMRATHSRVCANTPMWRS